MSSTLAPISGITDDNHSGVVLVFVIAAGCFSIFFSIVRFGSAAQQERGFGADDAFFVLCLALLVVQAVTIGLAVHNGLGQHAASLTANQIGNFFKVTYTSRIVATLSMGCAKFSVCYLFKRLELYTSWRAHLISIASAAVWTVFSVFALAFSCSLPSPWIISSSHCTSGSGIMIAVATVNAVTDAILALYPIPGLWRLAMSLHTRLTVIALFSSRLLVCAMAAIDAIYETRIFGSQDQTWDHITAAITGAMLVNLSLIAAAVPRLHNYLSKIPSGTSSLRIPSSLHLGRSVHINRTVMWPKTDTGHSTRRRTSESLRLVPVDSPATLITHISTHRNQPTDGRALEGTGDNTRSTDEDSASAGSRHSR